MEGLCEEGIFILQDYQMCECGQSLFRMITYCGYGGTHSLG